jgi:hypothetical protein
MSTLSYDDPAFLSLWRRSREVAMSQDFFNPFHVLALLLSTAILCGGPFVAGYYLGRYVELKKSKGPGAS